MHNPSVREVIFKLHQHAWQQVPPETREQCLTAFEGLGHSKANEVGFKETKDYKRANIKGHSIRRLMRHYIPVKRGVIDKVCGRKEVQCGVHSPA